MIGQTISHFRILEKLGEGGMGVVYRAEDTNLKRTVALKFLPHGLEAHEHEQARFLQEAQAASAINHPHVCTIHEIAAEGGQQFIVMEYVDGKTLRQMVPVQKTQTAIDYAIQIGEALQEAHSKGIVHRDIKTDNIMVDTKNQVKVMDFGLAKLKGSLKLTKTSSTVGTLAYMAPEQIEGGEVDARSDIFSFGVVLYEMLTGHMPFRGEHEAAIVYSIVNEEPTPIQKYLPEISSEFVHVLNRALEKDPNDRYQNVAEMVIDLRRLKKQTSRVSRLTSPPEPTKGTPEAAEIPTEVLLRRPRWLSRRRLVLGSIAAAAVVFGALYLVFMRSPLPKLNPKMTTRVIEVPFAEIGYPTLSSDGKWIAFAAVDLKGKWDFYFMHVGSPEVKRVTFDSLPGFMNQCVDISPDGGRIAYDQYNNRTMTKGIYVASPLTGESRRLVDTGYAPVWRPDGERIGYVRYDTIGFLRSMSGKPEFWSVRPDGTDKRLEFVDAASTVTLTLGGAWSPDSKSVAYLSTRVGTSQEVYVRNLRDGSERQLTHLNSAIDNVRWAKNGVILFSSNKSGTTNLWMVSPDGGDPAEFTRGASPYLDVGMSNDCNTFLAYQRMQVNRMWIADLETTEAHPITADEQLYFSPSFSPDGGQIVFAMGSGDPLSGVRQICVADRDGQRRKQVTPGNPHAQFPLWSPDGKWIAYADFSERTYTAWIQGSSQCYVVDATSPAEAKRVGEGVPFLWTGNESFVSWRIPTFGSWQTFIDGREEKRVSSDSTIAVPLHLAEQFLVIDLRRSSQGLYMGSVDSLRQPLSQKLRLVHSFKPSWRSWMVTVSPERTFALMYNRQLEFWQIKLPSGIKERVRRTFPELQFATGSVHISNDGKSIAYEGRMQTKSKLVLMENPFD